MIADYFNRVNPDLLAFIPPDAKIVLEIGCGAGALAEAYRRINPGVEWSAFEKNLELEMAAYAPGLRCDRVFPCDIEAEIDNGFLVTQAGNLDCLIFGDVLEHLHNPWKVLRLLASDLAPGAQVLASIPNIQHFSVLYNLLFGHFKYADEGVMDKTHLRWFTLEGIREMFDQAGLQIHEVRGIRSPADGDGWKLWSEFIAPLNIDLRQTAPLQYLVRAIKPVIERDVVVKDTQEGKPRTHGMAIDVTVTEKTLPIQPIHIHAVTAEPCCARPRIHEPFQALSTIPGVKCTTESVFSGPFFLRNRDEPLIWIQQRDRSFSEKHQRGILDLGAIIIAELDDDPAGLQGYPENDYIQLRAVHAVQVSTERLAETVREFNPNVMVFENQIADLPQWKDKKDDGNIRIFYGAQNRQTDWAPIMPALHRILKDRPDISMIVMADEEFAKALPDTAIHRFEPFSEYSKYREILRSCDIALLPLEPSRFNEHKSDIKFLECAAEGVAVVASTTVYKDTILQGDGMGAFYSSPAAFELVFNVLIDNQTQRQMLAQKAYSYVRDHRMLGQHFRKRLAWYRDLLQSKADLDRQLFERVPALRPAQLVPSVNHP